MRRSTWVAVAALLLTASAPAAAASPRVVGGPPIDVTTTPWQVVLTITRVSGAALCGGVIVSDQLVVTAAHCVADAVSPRAVRVRAGISSTGAGGASAQFRVGEEVRVHPYWRARSGSFADDVAVVRLRTPLALDGPAVKPVRLPDPRVPLGEGAPVMLGGFGVDAPGQPRSGLLRRYDARLGQAGCPGSADAVLLCVSSPTSSTCDGDSGSGLVVDHGGPVLVGVAVAGPAGCAPGTTRLVTRAGAPEILDFIRGSTAPPRAPRALGRLRLMAAGPMRVGTLLRCAGPGWRDAASVEYAFVEPDGRVLWKGTSPRYRLGPGDVGRRVGCRVTASSPGGTGVQRTPIVGAAVTPSALGVTLASVTTRAGRRVRISGKLSGMGGRRGEVRVCVAPVRRVLAGGCRTHAMAKAERQRFGMQVRVRRAAPPGRHVLRVTVALHPGPTAVARGTLVVRGRPVRPRLRREEPRARDRGRPRVP